MLFVAHWGRGTTSLAKAFVPVIGPDMKGNPFTVMQNMDDGSVFHAFIFESQKHSGLLWRQ